MDVRVGGVWRRVMRSADGNEYRASGVYQEIVPPERLVFTYAWENNPDQSQQQTLVTLSFTELDNNRTELNSAGTPSSSIPRELSFQAGPVSPATSKSYTRAVLPPAILAC
jgi:uncharacterized protein YndB with AHSA1/START domain